MEWKTTDRTGYQPRSMWNSDRIPDLPCIRDVDWDNGSTGGARSVLDAEHDRVIDAVCRAVAPFPDARRAVIEAMRPLDPPLRGPVTAMPPRTGR